MTVIAAGAVAGITLAGRRTGMLPASLAESLTRIP